MIAVKKEILSWKIESMDGAIVKKGHLQLTSSDIEIVTKCAVGCILD